MTIDEIVQYKVYKDLTILDIANEFDFGFVKLNKQSYGFVNYLLRGNAESGEDVTTSAVVYCPLEKKWKFFRLNKTNSDLITKWNESYKKAKKNKVLFGFLMEYRDRSKADIIETVLQKDSNAKMLSAFIQYDINTGEMNKKYGLKVLSGVLHRGQKRGDYYRPVHFHYTLECTLQTDSAEFQELVSWCV